MPKQDPYDFTDKYNTKLSDKEEAQFQKEMKDSLGDLYDYDVRGFWKEMKNGTASKDKNGHGIDKYKKPNHITFSDESIYNGVDGYQGGHWTQDETGAYTYTPSPTSMYSDEDRRAYWIDGDESNNGNHLNTSNGQRLVTGANADIRAGLAGYPQNAQNLSLSEGMGLVNLGNGKYAEILPDGSTAMYGGLSARDMMDSRQDMINNSNVSEPSLIDKIGKATHNVINQIFPETMAKELQRRQEQVPVGFTIRG